MIFLFGLLSAAAPAAATSKAICEVGRVALRDLAVIEINRGVETYYEVGGPDHHRDLLDACPTLRRNLPASFPMADDQARARANVHVPVPGPPLRGVFIYQIDVPELSDDQTKATVHFNYQCSGLCGGMTDAHYVRTKQGWRREGGFIPVAVS